MPTAGFVYAVDVVYLWQEFWRSIKGDLVYGLYCVMATISTCVKDNLYYNFHSKKIVGCKRILLQLVWSVMLIKPSWVFLKGFSKDSNYMILFWSATVLAVNSGSTSSFSCYWHIYASSISCYWHIYVSFRLVVTFFLNVYVGSCIMYWVYFMFS